MVCSWRSIEYLGQSSRCLSSMMMILIHSATLSLLALASFTIAHVQYKRVQTWPDTGIGKLIEFGCAVNCVGVTAYHVQLVQIQSLVIGICHLIAAKMRAPVLMASDCG